MKELCFTIGGSCKVLGDLMLPLTNGEEKLIDRLLIHETGLYIIDIRDEEGVICGSYKDDTWTTSARAGQVSIFENPIRTWTLVETALQTMFPGISVHLLIVFAAGTADLLVTDWEFTKATVCRSDEVEEYMRHITSTVRGGLSPKKIDEVFQQLLPYAEMYPVKEETITAEEEVDYAYLLAEQYAQPSEEMKPVEIQEVPSAKGKKHHFTLLLCLSVLLFSLCFGILVKWMVDKRVEEKCIDSVMQDALARMDNWSQKIRHFKMDHTTYELNSTREGYELKNDYIGEVYGENEIHARNPLVLFACRVLPQEQYMLYTLARDASIVVGFRDGTGIEYTNITEKDLKVGFGQGWDIGPLLIPCSQIKDIAYINLCGVNIRLSEDDSGMGYYGPNKVIPLYAP